MKCFCTLSTNRDEGGGNDNEIIRCVYSFRKFKTFPPPYLSEQGKSSALQSKKMLRLVLLCNLLS